MAVYEHGKIWWFKFVWNGEPIRESTKQGNKPVAEQIEAARKAALAKGEVGIRDRKPIPIFADFVRAEFLPYVESRFANKPRTLAYYQLQIKHLLTHRPLADAKLDAITPEMLTGFIEKRRVAEYQTSSINRALQVLRRILKLAVEWGVLEKAPAKVSLLPGERRRERVLSLDEEAAYLTATWEIGDSIIALYERALEGIRAKQRGEQPMRPADPYLLRDVATVLFDCVCVLRSATAYGGSMCGTGRCTCPAPRQRTHGAVPDRRIACFRPVREAAISNSRPSRSGMRWRAAWPNSNTCRSTRFGIPA